MHLLIKYRPTTQIMIQGKRNRLGEVQTTGHVQTMSYLCTMVDVQTRGVMYYEIGRIPYIPNFHGNKPMKQIDQQIGDFAGRWDRGILGWILGDRKEKKPLCFRQFDLFFSSLMAICSYLFGLSLQGLKWGWMQIY